MDVLVACKNEEDPIKNEGTRVVTTLFLDFSHTQGQLTPKSAVESCRKSNPFKLLWLTLLPARMKKIHWKMKALEWSHLFSHYKSMGIFPNAQGQLTHKSFVGYCPISNPSKILWLSSLPAHGLQSLPPSPKRAERKGRRRPFREAGSGHKQWNTVSCVDTFSIISKFSAQNSKI